MLYHMQNTDSTYRIGETYYTGTRDTVRTITVDAIEPDRIIGGLKLIGRDDRGYRITAHESRVYSL